MNEYRVPSPDDLNAYVVLIRFLRQAHSLMQDINDEAERFNDLLQRQREVLDQHRLSPDDFESSLTDYEESLERVKARKDMTIPEKQP